MKDREAAKGFFVRGCFQIAKRKGCDKMEADRLICLCFRSVKSSNQNHKTLFWHDEPCLGLSLDCLKFIIPGGKLSLHCKYTDCFIYNFIGCLDHRLLRCFHFCGAVICKRVVGGRQACTYASTEEQKIQKGAK